jgi:hypothetical protein
MIEGKGIWLWYASQLLPYFQTVEKALDSLVENGFSHIIPKFSNGWYAWLPKTPEGKYLPRLFDGARERGLKIYPFHYSYSYTLSSEINAVTAAYNEYGGDGLVIDAEEEYKRVGTDVFALGLVTGLKVEIDKPIGYSTYRYPSVHQDFPFAAFDEVCDFRSPQVYWEGAHNPAYQLERSYNEYKRMSDKPYYPVGAAYEEHGWHPEPDDVDAFDEKAHELGLKSISWWRWDEALRLNLYDELCQHDWPVDGIPYLSDKEKLDIIYKWHKENYPEYWPTSDN